MRLTRSGDYGVRCLLYLALHARRGVVGRKEIAEAMDIPAQYLGKVAQTLARAGLITIRQGLAAATSWPAIPKRFRCCGSSRPWTARSS
jgi:Rrf2 family protein